MPRVKTSDLPSLRKLLKQQGSAAEARLRELLDPAPLAIYDLALQSEWHPAPDFCQLLQASAEVLFPGERSAMTRLGQALAHGSFSGVYRVFLTLPTLAFLVRRTPVMWSWYHDTGEAVVEDQTETGMSLVVRGTPDLPRPLLHVVSGHVLALGDLTRTKNAKVRVDPRDPMSWRWVIEWDA